MTEEMTTEELGDLEKLFPATKKGTKYCPLQSASCMENDCAWYVPMDYGADCSIRMIALAFKKGIEIRK